jgi:hypothetical protein
MGKHNWLMLILLLILWLIFFPVKCNFNISPAFSPIGVHSPLITPACSPANAFYGAIMGRLFLTNGQPAVGSILYLGEYVGLETSRPMVILDPSRNLHAQTGEGGVFCFSEVPPGKYGIIVWDAVESILLPDPATGYSLLIEVKSGNTVDVGILYSPIP